MEGQDFIPQPAAQPSPDFLGAPAPTRDKFYAVSTTKLTLLTIFTLNIYSIYWMYQQWKAIRDSGETPRDISPLGRAIFGIFFVHELFSAVRLSANGVGLPGDGASSGNATMWLVLGITANLLSRLPGPLAMIGIVIGFATVIPMGAAQKEINNYLRKLDPAADLNEGYSAGNVIVLILGGLFLLTMIAGTLLPNNPPGGW